VHPAHVRQAYDGRRVATADTGLIPK